MSVKSKARIISQSLTNTYIHLYAKLSVSSRCTPTTGFPLSLIIVHTIYVNKIHKINLRGAILALKHF